MEIKSFKRRRGLRADPRRWIHEQRFGLVKAFEHDADHGKADEGSDGHACATLEFSGRRG
jgi:hypothetical protein